MMRSIILIAIHMLLLGVAAIAQETSVDDARYLEFVLSPDAVMTFPLGTLESIRGSVPCSPTFEASPGANPGFSLRIGYVLRGGLEKSLWLRGVSLVAGVDDISSNFLSGAGQSFEAYDAVNDRYVMVETEHTAAYTLNYLRAAVEAEATPGAGIILRAGPSIGIPLSASVRESEAILSPSNATFLDRTQEQEIPEGTGELDDAGVRVGIGAGITYRLPLGRRFFFEPSVGIDLGLTPVQPGWSPLLVRGGIGIGYAAIPEPAPVEPPPTPVVVREEPVLRDVPFTADLSIQATPASIPVEFRRQIVARYTPMLPVIFFDRNSSSIPSRYKQLGDDYKGGDYLVPCDAESAHHDVLNSIGLRLRPSVRIRVTITGTTSTDESNREKLAGERAEAVAQYLEKIWGISRNRLIIRSRVDPALPSNSRHEEGREENRRVELEFSDEAVNGSHSCRTVEPVTELRMIPFRVSAASPLSMERWQATITGANGWRLKDLEGTGAPPEMITWELSGNDRERVMAANGINYSLTVFDSAGRSISTAPSALPIVIDTTISFTTSMDRPENSAEFLLVTFDFDRAELTRLGRKELATILDRIGPQSRVEVVGYTDRVGDQEHNMALAAERARKIAELMPKGVPVEHRGASPDEAPYGNDTPEGRFLSRTVRVVITNPK